MTGTQVFKIAMSLSDNLVNGVADVSDNLDYKNRTVDIINTILPELYMYSDTKVITAGSKPVPTFMTDLTDEIDLDDALSATVLPHSLVASLFVEENPQLARYHEQKAIEKLRKISQVPNEFEDIYDYYGALDYSSSSVIEG